MDLLPQAHSHVGYVVASPLIRRLLEINLVVNIIAGIPLGRRSRIEGSTKLLLLGVEVLGDGVAVASQDGIAKGFVQHPVCPRELVLGGGGLAGEGERRD